MQVSPIAAAKNFDPDAAAAAVLPKYMEEEVEGEPALGFEELQGNVDRMANKVANMKEAAVEFVRASKLLADAGMRISKEIEGFYQEGQSSWLATSQISVCLELGQGQMRYGHYKEMHEYVRNYVIAPLNYWMDEYKQVAVKNQARNLAAEKVQHYTKKIEKLNENAREVRNKGKILSEKVAARISRNEYKLETARKELEELNRKGLADLQRVWNGRNETFGYVMKHFIESEGLFFNKIATVANKLASAHDKFEREGEYAFCDGSREGSFNDHLQSKDSLRKSLQFSYHADETDYEYDSKSTLSKAWESFQKRISKKNLI
jgi:hypothetical protein